MFEKLTFLEGTPHYSTLHCLGRQPVCVYTTVSTFLLFINSFLEPQCHVSLITDMFSIANRTQGPACTCTSLLLLHPPFS